jgi:hypothetical protein
MHLFLSPIFVDDIGHQFLDCIQINGGDDEVSRFRKNGIPQLSKVDATKGSRNVRKLFTAGITATCPSHSSTFRHSRTTTSTARLWPVKRSLQTGLKIVNGRTTLGGLHGRLMVQI